MKIAIAGSVQSSNVILEEAIAAGIYISMVFSLDEQYSKGVSGYYPLHLTAEKNALPYTKIHNINDEKNVEILRKIEPDYLFVVGLSQLVKKDVLDCPKKGVIGLHPTALPKHRGRAAMVWQILLGVRESKVTMFLLDQGMDTGDIIDQEPYCIYDSDYAKDLDKRSLIALQRLSKRIMQMIKTNTIVLKKQNELEATYLLMRYPEDGQIDWSLPCKKIQRLIRAVSRPYPGAFSYYEGEKVIFWKADYLNNNKYFGSPGQIAEISDNTIDIVCTDGLLRVYEYETLNNLKYKKGHKFLQSFNCVR